MAPILYMSELNPPVRGVLLLAKAIGVQLERKEVNLMAGDNLTDAYIKMNPQHTIPTLDDDGFILWDSHAIMAYLVSKYSKGNSLYPEDPQQRAIVDQRLHFDTGVTFSILKATVKPILMQHAKLIPKEKVDDAHEAYGFLEKFLGNQEWVAGKATTLADLSLISTVSTMDFFFPIEASKYPNVASWMKRCESLPCYSENKPGLAKFKAFFTAMMAN